MKYEYMIIYETEIGIGRCCLTTITPIDTFEKITEIDKMLVDKNHFRQAMVVNFKLLRKIKEENDVDSDTDKEEDTGE
jgi:hypothetical protein